MTERLPEFSDWDCRVYGHVWMMEDERCSVCGISHRQAVYEELAADHDPHRGDETRPDA